MTADRRVLGLALGAAGVAGAAVHAARRRRRPATDGELEVPQGVLRRAIEARDGGRISFLETGSGPAVVLLHGAALRAEVWAYQLRDLKDRRHLVAIDQRGHGRSEPGRRGVTLTAMADDLADVLEGLDLSSALLVGHSMGGMSLLRFARRHPEVLSRRAGGLLLLSTTGGLAYGGPGFDLIAPLLGAADSLVHGGRAAEDGSGGLFSSFGGRAVRFGFGVSPAPAQLASVSSMMRSSKGDRLGGLVGELARFDERAPFAEVGVPATIVVGDRDRLTPPSQARRLAGSIPGSRLVVWPGAGHMVMYERREALDWLIEELASK